LPGKANIAFTGRQVEKGTGRVRDRGDQRAGKLYLADHTPEDCRCYRDSHGRFGRLDILFNNAGAHGNAEQTNEPHWRLTLI
jgi:NAD(P)-dependent dehydrogenase (short-subunit alcohol dehydrogenase family)